MTVKEFLRDIKRKSVSIKMIEDQLERLRSMAEYKSPVPDPIGGGHGTGNPHSRENLVIRVTELSARLDNMKLQMLGDIDKATTMILSLQDDKTLQVFYKRYLQFLTWERIADELDISFQWVHELHKRGLIELSRRFSSFD